MDVLFSWPSLPSTAGEWLIAIGLLAAIAAYAAISVAFEDRRRRDYVRYCRERNFQFDEKRPGEEQRHLATCPLFSQGDDPVWGMTIRGVHHGAHFLAFEFEWDTIRFLQLTSRRPYKTHKIAGVIWTLEKRVPQFLLEPKSVKTELAELLGAGGVVITSAPEFSAAHRLHGTDERAIRALWTPEVCSSFTTHADQHLSGAGTELMWWRDGPLPPPNKVDQFLDGAARARALLAHE